MNAAEEAMTALEAAWERWWAQPGERWADMGRPVSINVGMVRPRFRLRRYLHQVNCELGLMGDGPNVLRDRFSPDGTPLRAAEANQNFQRNAPIMAEISRQVLQREFETMESEFGPIQIKCGYLNGECITRAPEMGDCEKAAEKHNVAVRTVYEAARKS